MLVREFKDSDCITETCCPTQSWCQVWFSHSVVHVGLVLLTDITVVTSWSMEFCLRFIVWVLKSADYMKIAEVCVSGAGSFDLEMQITTAVSEFLFLSHYLQNKD